MIMRETTPNAFVLSIGLHGAIVALAFALAWFASQHAPETRKIIELVAGPGDDDRATEAARGAEDGVRLNVTIPSLAPLTMPEPAPSEPVSLPPDAIPSSAEPIAQPVPQPAVKSSPTKPPPTVPDLVKTIQRAENRSIKLEKNKAAAEQAAQERRLKEQILKDKRVSYAQFQAEQNLKNGSKPTGIRAGSPAPRIDSAAIARGLTNGTGVGAGGNALTAEQQTAMNAYISRLVQALKDAIMKPPGLNDPIHCRVQFFISAHGGLSNMRIVSPSGNAEFDDAVIAAFRAVGSIGPTPDGKSDTWALTFYLKDE